MNRSKGWHYKERGPDKRILLAESHLSAGDQLPAK